MKTCIKCGHEKPLTDFYARTSASDGRRGECIACARLIAIANRNENIDQYRAYDKARCMSATRIAERKRYAKTPEGKAAVRRRKDRYLQSGKGRTVEYETRSQYKSADPIRRLAHSKVTYAVRSGKLKRQPCEVCADSSTHAHHDDYSKPLDVRWLCPLHHAEWHKNNLPAR